MASFHRYVVGLHAVRENFLVDFCDFSSVLTEDA